MHWQRWKRHGDPLGGVWHQRPGGGYQAAHWRVRQIKGKASAYPCAHCDAPGAEWAYDHADPDEQFGHDHGRMVPFSTDPDHYISLCVPCHRRLDAPKRRATA